MTRIAVLGANGQVGAELCLILKNHPDIEVVPICRNKGGSAFLRYSGIRCRHGLPADPEQGARLFGDCDLIVNAALGYGTPKQIRETEDALILNAVACSQPRARIVYFSTQMVHGDPNPDVWFRTCSAYGRAKLRSERLLRAVSARAGKQAYILRLGHVCGELQNITAQIRERIRTNNVFLPKNDRPSNTVYTCTIADAVLKIAAEKEKPGTYDLMSYPEWSWREVYDYEAEHCKCQFEPKFVKIPVRSSILQLLGLSKIRSLFTRIVTSPAIKDSLLQVITYTSKRLNERLQAKWFQIRARREIQELDQQGPYHDALIWVAMGREFMTSLDPTRDLLGKAEFQISKRDPARAWQEDLPLANMSAPSSTSSDNTTYAAPEGASKNSFQV